MEASRRKLIALKKDSLSNYITRVKKIVIFTVAPSLVLAASCGNKIASFEGGGGRESGSTHVAALLCVRKPRDLIFFPADSPLIPALERAKSAGYFILR